jgi:hypothetical protein
LRDPREWPTKKGDLRIREVRADFEGREVSLWFYPGTARFRINLKNDRNPIPWDQMNEFRTWLNGLLYPLSVDKWSVIELGVNVDYVDLRMDGLKSGTFQEWTNAVERAYQKLSHVLRNEIHTAPMNSHKRILPFEKVIEKLVEGSPVMRMERMINKELEAARLNAETARLRLEIAKLGGGGVPRRKPSEVNPGEAWEVGFG